MITVKRIQRRRTKGWRMPPNTVYVGRGSKWGNQFYVDPEHTLDTHNPPEHIASIFACKTAKEAIRKYKNTNIRNSDYLPKRKLYKQIYDIRKELGGKNLACWCPLDKPCHADILLKLANPKGETK